MECAQIRNTPLHYTCKWEDCGISYGNPIESIDRKTTMAQKVAITKVLLGYGAVYKTNSLGLTPICYAGLHQMRPLVDLLGDEMESKEAVDASLKNEKIKGLEFLGIAYGLHDYLFTYRTSHSVMLEAKQLSLTYSYPVPRSDSSCEIEKLFKRKECSTIEELQSLGQDKDAIRVEGFLLGARSIPDELKPQYYWNALLKFGRSRKDFAQTCSIISFLVRMGNTTKLALYETFDALQFSIWMSDPISLNISDLNDVMTLCIDYLSASSTHEKYSYIQEVVELLTNTAIRSHGKQFETLTTSVIRILKPCTKHQELRGQ